MESNLKLLEKERAKHLTGSQPVSPAPSATHFAPALLSGLSFKPTSIRTDPLFIPSKRLSFESSLALASNSLSPAPQIDAPPTRDSHSRFLELSRQAETSITSPESITPRRLRSDGKGHYQIRSGSLEPIGGAISRSALAEATQRARQALRTEVDAEALRLETLLTIKEDGGEAIPGKGLEGVRRPDGEEKESPDVVRRSIQLISVKEGSGRLVVQMERSKVREGSRNISGPSKLFLPPSMMARVKDQIYGWISTLNLHPKLRNKVSH